MKEVTIRTPYIALGQFLKLSDCISTGGHAKAFLEETTITVNGELEARRGKKLYDQDVIVVEGYGTFCIRVTEPGQEA